jgi:diamine N-acetyltransferase
MLKGPNIILRAPEMEDLPTIYRWENDPALQVVSPHFHPVSAFAVEQYILSMNPDPFVTGSIRWMAVHAPDERILGHIDLFEVDPHHRRGGVGILLEASERNKGFGTEMLQLIMGWSQNTLGLHQLWCKIVLPNVASEKLFASTGFIQTGLQRQWIRQGASRADVAFLQKIF